jgi:hypothetical protein
MMERITSFQSDSVDLKRVKSNSFTNGKLRNVKSYAPGAVSRNIDDYLSNGSGNISIGNGTIGSVNNVTSNANGSISNNVKILLIAERFTGSTATGMLEKLGYTGFFLVFFLH